MQLNLIAFSIPMFLLFIGLEYLYSKKKGKNYFGFAESVANLNVGIAERLLDLFTTGLFVYFFDYIHQHYALFDLKPGPFTWIGLFLLTDLVWYWYHRLAHEVTIFWAAHVVHHQSEDFNYTVSARITVFQAVIRCMFWAVLPLIGFPASMISLFLLVHGLYPFFIHTQTIGKLGWIEYIMVTPSHHRVHHSSNPAYLDKNYGDVLIIWDKLFGTFTAEKEQPIYGLTKPLNSHSFLWQHFHFPLEVACAFKNAAGWRQKLKILFGKPDNIDPSYRELLAGKFLNVNTSLQSTRLLKQYIILQTIISLLLLFVVSLLEKNLSVTLLILSATFILLSLINSGAILDQRAWVFYLEYARILVLLIGIGLYYPGILTGLTLISLFTVLVYFFRPMKRRYERWMYEPVES